MMAAERIKVLYVDDEDGNLMAFRAGFRRDMDVRIAHSGPEALAMMEVDLPHVVISDQRMPRMSGAEFLASVRDRWPRVIRILMTGYSDIEAMIDAVNKGGIHAYITKPWDPLDLKLRIEQAYEVHALKAEHERMFQRYRQVFDSSGDPIVIVDERGRFHEANPAAEALMGLARAELLNTDLRQLVDDPTGLLQAMRRHRKGHAFNNVEVTLHGTGNGVFDCLMTATYLGRSEDGAALFQAMIKDISDRKQEEKRLKKLNHDLDLRVAVRTKQLREALQDLEAFSYSVAHDLRSPLKTIRSLSDHMAGLAAQRGDPEVSDMSVRIHRGATRLTTLVDDLLRFARTDKQGIERAWLDLREVVLECLSTMDLSERRLRITMPEAGIAMIHADPSMMRVVMTNLLSNAIKFTRPCDMGEVTVGFDQEGTDARITVRDNGVGFDPDKVGQLFGVFKRLHAADQFEGTGIGLAIVQRVVQKHGGTCWAEGSPGKGACISFDLPGAASANRLRKVG